jgi:hypothetical protein
VILGDVPVDRSTLVFAGFADYNGLSLTACLGADACKADENRAWLRATKAKTAMQ